MDLGLNGKVALVTGAGRGVGREIALTLAREGASVAINYRSSAKDADALAAEIAAAGGKAKAYRADVADFAAVTAMVGHVVKDFGALNILINNAGLAKRQRFVETTPADWHSQIDACLYGAIHCCHATSMGIPYTCSKLSAQWRLLSGSRRSHWITFSGPWA